VASKLHSCSRRQMFICVLIHNSHSPHLHNFSSQEQRGCRLLMSLCVAEHGESPLPQKHLSVHQLSQRRAISKMSHKTRRPALDIKAKPCFLTTKLAMHPTVLWTGGSHSVNFDSVKIPTGCSPSTVTRHKCTTWLLRRWFGLVHRLNALTRRIRGCRNAECTSACPDHS
jgi:hypothetical protein